MDLKTAERVARRKVQAMWPELDGVEPSVAPRQYAHLSAAAANRLGLERQPAAGADQGTEYTFTFAGELCTPEGQHLPRVARVVVNSRYGIVKASISK